MRLLADTNIVRAAVRELRTRGHDVVHIAERAQDPGDAALLEEAHREGRVLISKDHDMGTLVFRDAAAHAGVLLIDDLGDVGAETGLIVRVLDSHAAELAAGAFIRAGAFGVRFGQT